MSLQLASNTADLVLAAGRAHLLGRLLRWAARLVPDQKVVRIPCGANAGMQWRHRTGYVSGYWTGTYEPEMQRAVRRWLKRGQRMFDVGAHAGFFTLLAARRVGRTGVVVAFEPQPPLAAAVREHAALNRQDQVRVVEMAVGGSAGNVELETFGTNSSQARVRRNGAPTGGVPVRMGTLDQAAEVHGVPDLVKMDVEGAEAEALDGASQLLARGRTTWIVETHGYAVHRCVRAHFARAGYAIRDLRGRPLRADVEDEPHVVALPEVRSVPTACSAAAVVTAP